MKKPACIHVEEKVREMIADPDALSQPFWINRNGRWPNEKGTIAFVELTPELLEWLRAQKWDVT